MAPLYICTGEPASTVYVYIQESQLYYDADSGTYYEFDPETRQYQVHSHVKLPKKRPDPEAGVEKVTSLCSSSDSEHEGIYMRIIGMAWMPASRNTFSNSEILCSRLYILHDHYSNC